MEQLVLLLTCLALGAALRALRVLPAETPRVLVALVVNVAVPAVALRTLHDPRALASPSAALWPIALTWLMIGLGWLATEAVAGPLQLTRQERGGFFLTVSWANTSFVGFPLLLALRGPDSLGLALLIDQLGSFLSLSTLGVVLAARYEPAGATDARPALLQRVVALLRFPPLVGSMAALLLRPIPFPALVDDVLGRLGALVVPLALLTVGFQLRLSAADLRRWLVPLSAALLIRLLLLPALVLGAGVALSMERVALDTTLLELAMPPMIMATILAEERGLAPRFVHLATGIGILLSLATVPGWSWLVRNLWG